MSRKNGLIAHAPKPSIVASLWLTSTFLAECINRILAKGCGSATPQPGNKRYLDRFPRGERQRVKKTNFLPGSGALNPMPEAQIARGVQLLDLMLEYFADDGHWTRGRYDDGNGGHCLVGALLHLSRKHRLPRAA